MQCKIIALPKRKKYSLSRLMVVALVEASIKQQQGIPFGPADIKGGSIVPLINRGLIIYKKVKIDNESHYLWQVTPEGIDLLRAMGVDAVA